MIPSISSAATAPSTTGQMSFHVIIDNIARTFSVDGPKTNGVHLHYEMMQVSREQNHNFRNFDLRADFPKGPP
jgi:hypothetical protein